MYLDPQWTRELIAGSVGFSECRIDEVEANEGEIRRHMYVVPRVHLPGAVVKILGPRFGYHEHGVLDRGEGRWSWSHRLGVLSDRIKMAGTMRIEPAAGQTCRRTAEITIEARLFAVGSLVELAAEQATRDGWAKSARWINDWLRENPK